MGREWLPSLDVFELLLWVSAAMLLTLRAKPRRVAHSGEWHARHNVRAMAVACVRSGNSRPSMVQ